MKILVTGSKGFIGKNLVENLKNIRDGKDKSKRNLVVTDIFEYDRDMDSSVLEEACTKVDFVFHLAGVNRPEDPADFIKENSGSAEELLKQLQIHKNTCPVMFSSSSQASLAGRFADSEYGKSKLDGERLFFQYAALTGAKVLIYRFPNLFGKWCRPNYNSAVATFCHAVANDLEYKVNDRSTRLDLVYIDDLIQEMMDALEGKEHHCEQEGWKTIPAKDGCYCYVPTVYSASLGEIVDLLQSFKSMPKTFFMPETLPNSFAKKLHSTYLSYLPPEKVSYPLNSNMDERGSFTELIKTMRCGQGSINVIRPGITKGNHWHNHKWEIFIVVSGHGLIQERKIGVDPDTDKEYPIHCFEMDGAEMRAVQILPGYTHSIRNLSDTQDLITVMWANEPFDPEHPDTFQEPVEESLEKFPDRFLSE